MPEENFILSKDFIDFDIFAVPEENAKDFEPSTEQQLSTLAVFPESDNQNELTELLHNILRAAKLDIDKEVHSLPITPQADFSFIQMQSKAAFEKALLFGVTPSKLGIHLDLKPYQPLPFQGCIFLLADKLSDIQKDNTKKKALWACLQEIYRI